MKLLKVAYFALHERLPVTWQGSLRNLWMNSAVRRKLRKRRGDRARQERQQAIARHGRWGVASLLAMLREQGLAEGDVVFVQCSYNDLHTFEGSPLALLQMLQQLVGATGTLLMPAYTGGVTSPGQPFRPQADPTYTGILCEIFRRSEGVLRSLHPRHSICGQGPLAAELLSGHEACVRADGPDSPFDRMRRLPHAKILTLGLPPAHVSFLHWLEDVQPERLPFAVLRSEPVRGAVEMPDGSIREVLDWHVKSDVAARLSLGPLAGNLSKAACNFIDFRGVAIGIYSMPVLASELLQLRDRGIIHYS